MERFAHKCHVPPCTSVRAVVVVDVVKQADDHNLPEAYIQIPSCQDDASELTLDTIATSVTQILKMFPAEYRHGLPAGHTTQD